MPPVQLSAVASILAAGQQGGGDLNQIGLQRLMVSAGSSLLIVDEGGGRCGVHAKNLHSAITSSVQKAATKSSNRIPQPPRQPKPLNRLSAQPTGRAWRRQKAEQGKRHDLAHEAHGHGQPQQQPEGPPFRPTRWQPGSAMRRLRAVVVQAHQPTSAPPAISRPIAAGTEPGHEHQERPSSPQRAHGAGANGESRAKPSAMAGGTGPALARRGQAGLGLGNGWHEGRRWRPGCTAVCRGRQAHQQHGLRERCGRSAASSLPISTRAGHGARGCPARIPGHPRRRA